VFIGTFYSKNLISYAKSADNISYLLAKNNISETTSETSFNFTNFRRETNLSEEQISDN
jgi:hypothetical protein